ncbi:hypothetical protein PanWU01x14_134690 [Parasponia andersonii]|uniref:Uncharacterized protein n=1 Tax=Parasponia andersonii TaxID=3476 RepID=A0A2P5CPT3_PARAD|nr:hypothetical protein PanWU01x14_134690 [Parasponia andersonii]
MMRDKKTGGETENTRDKPLKVNLRSELFSTLRSKVTQTAKVNLQSKQVKEQNLVIGFSYTSIDLYVCVISRWHG